MEFDGFDWDEGNREKRQKHGLSTAEIEGVFGRSVLVGPDPAHSDAEQRYRALGRTTTGRPVFIVFTWRLTGSRRFLRPISARYMHQKEVARHGKEIP